VISFRLKLAIILLCLGSVIRRKGCLISWSQIIRSMCRRGKKINRKSGSSELMQDYENRALGLCSNYGD